MFNKEIKYNGATPARLLFGRVNEAAQSCCISPDKKETNLAEAVNNIITIIFLWKN